MMRNVAVEHHQEAQDDAPGNVAPPQHGTPAVGRHLDASEQDHRRGDVHEQQQQPEQEHATGHAEHAGNEGGDDDGDSDHR
jgi:hypothetical protein